MTKFDDKRFPNKNPQPSSASASDDSRPLWRVPEIFPQLGEVILGKLKAYHSELIYFNGRMNLISGRTERNADVVHIVDGLMGAEFIMRDTKADEIYDIGSGNGVPGLLLALVAPQRKVILVDADARKIEYIKHCVSRLGLGNCTTLHARVEDLSAASIACAVSRGFAPLGKAMLAFRKCAAVGCEYYHFKSTNWTSELAGVPSQVLSMWEPRHIGDYTLPIVGGAMSILLTKRIGSEV